MGNEIEIIKIKEENLSKKDETFRIEIETGLKESIANLDKKTNKLWEEALADSDFINKFKIVEPIEIEENKYELFGYLKKDNHLEFGIKESPIKRSNRHSTLLYIVLENGKALKEENAEENLIDLAKYSIEKYKISKEIIRQIKEKYKQRKIDELKEMMKLMEKIHNIDK